MAIDSLVISYPNFVVGATIDPEQFDQNNDEIVDKINELVSGENALLAAFSIHDHDSDYYTEVEADAKFASIEEMQEYVAGAIIDGSLTDAKLSDTAGQIKERVATHIADADIHMSAQERTLWNLTKVYAYQNLGGF